MESLTWSCINNVSWNQISHELSHENGITISHMKLEAKLHRTTSRNLVEKEPPLIARLEFRSVVYAGEKYDATSMYQTSHRPFYLLPVIAP